MTVSTGHDGRANEQERFFGFQSWSTKRQTSACPIRSTLFSPALAIRRKTLTVQVGAEILAMNKGAT
jgi:hypothetical protein